MADTDTKMAPTSFNATTLTVGGQKPIYFYPSIAQSQREYQFIQKETDIDLLGLLKQYYTWVSNYWAFYRSGIRRNSQGVIECGWITVNYGCNYFYSEVNTFFFGVIPIGSDSYTGGKWPYQNETLNLVETPVILADAVRFD